MGKYSKIIAIAIFLNLVFSETAFCQKLTESEIKTLAEQVSRELQGVEIGNGVVATGCYSLGRTLMFHYNVPENWQKSYNMKEEIIDGFRTNGAAKTYFINDINVDFYYYRNKLLVEKISISSSEFSNSNAVLGDYMSLKGHPKAKGVDFKLQIPIGWNVKEGNRPNIVKSITKDGNSYMILVKDYITFFSRNEMKEMLQDDDWVGEMVQEWSALLKNAEVLDQRIITIDTYPTIEYNLKGVMESSGYKMSVRMKCWIVFYEDKLVLFQAVGRDNSKYQGLERLFSLITNSVIFPEQYH